MDDDRRSGIALWRYGVIGPLVSARLEHGDQTRLYHEAAGRVYEDVDGRRTELSPRTVEAWLARYRKGGLEALKPMGRSDAGVSRSISPEQAEQILAVKRDNPRRSIRRIIKLLERAGKVPHGKLKRSSVHRLLQAHGMSDRPEGEQEPMERRAFRHETAGDLWMGDVMHGRRVLAPDGNLRKCYLHLFVDSAVRFVPACAFKLSETAADHEAVLKQAVLKHGLPRVLYEDRGSAQTSNSLKVICAELGIRLLHCKPYTPEAKAGIERLFRTIREEVEDELGEKVWTLEDLNSVLWSWISTEYHSRVHSGTGRMPIEHWLSQASELRPAPRGEDLDRIFLHRCRRKVRKDATVRFGGSMLEVRAELRRKQVELRYDPHNPEALPQVFINGKFYCDTNELDLVRNSRRRRHPLPRPAVFEPDPATHFDALELIQQEHHRLIRPPRRGSQGKE